MGIEAIGTGIKTNLDTISGLRVFAPNELPDSVNELPCALVLPGETHITDFQGNFDAQYRILVLVTKQDAPSAYNTIYDYIEHSGSESIRAAIDADSTLDGSASDCILVTNTGIGFTTWGGIGYLSTEFILNVFSL